MAEFAAPPLFSGAPLWLWLQYIVCYGALIGMRSRNWGGAIFFSCRTQPYVGRRSKRANCSIQFSSWILIFVLTFFLLLPPRLVVTSVIVTVSPQDASKMCGVISCGNLSLPFPFPLPTRLLQYRVRASFQLVFGSAEKKAQENCFFSQPSRTKVGLFGCCQKCVCVRVQKFSILEGFEKRLEEN